MIHRNKSFSRVFVFWLLMLPVAGGCQEARQAEPSQATLDIVTADGGVVSYRVELAETRNQKSRGLMHREYLPPDSGMLFLYDPPRDVSMWMKNTRLSLDMIFIDEDGRIVRIRENTTPMSTRTISAGGKVRAVLELNAGQAAAHGIRVGDRVEYEVGEE